MKKKVIVSLLILGFLTISTTSLLSQKKGFNRSGMRFRSHMVQQNMIPAKVILMMKEKINLTDTQIKQINDLQASFKKYSIEMKSKTSTLNVDLESAFTEKKIDKKKVSTILKKLGALKTEMEINHIYHMLDVKDILTKEQIDQIEKLKLERRKSNWRSKRGDFRKRFRK